MKKWDFRSDNAARIRRQLSPFEAETFPIDLEKPDISDFLKNCILGGRQYCLKEPLSTLPKARAQLKM